MFCCLLLFVCCIVCLLYVLFVFVFVEEDVGLLLYGVWCCVLVSGVLDVLIVWCILCCVVL